MNESWVFDFPNGCIMNADDETDCVVQYDDLTKERGRLIAAAPELLTCCGAVLEFLRDRFKYAGTTGIEHALAAQLEETMRRAGVEEP